MPRPRFRLTLGRLMVWIAVATVDLWALATTLRVLDWSYAWQAILVIVGWLAVVNVLVAFVFSQIRAILATGRFTERDGQPHVDRYGVLLVSILFLAILAFPLIVVLAILADRVGIG